MLTWMFLNYKLSGYRDQMDSICSAVFLRKCIINGFCSLSAAGAEQPCKMSSNTWAELPGDHQKQIVSDTEMEAQRTTWHMGWLGWSNDKAKLSMLPSSGELQ